MTLTRIEYEETTGAYRTPGGRPVTFAYRRETNDHNTLYASLDGDEYNLPSDLSGIALDIGGYLGSVGIALAVDNPALRVYIVEPVPDNADLIERNIALNDLGDRVTLVRGAVGAGHEPVDVWYRYQGSVSLDHHAFVGNSSLAYDHGGEAPHETITYEGLTLADLLNMVDVERYGPYTDAGGPAETHLRHDPIRIAFLKIDCEGGEWAFLQSPEIWRVDTIVGEAHSVRGHKGKDMVSVLGETHDVTLYGDPEGTCEFRAVRR